MNPRLLFAAARGAKIQFSLNDGEWHIARNIDLVDAGWPHRIHPDDEHLEYGVIGTELRETASLLVPNDDVLCSVAHGGLFKVDWNYYDIDAFWNSDQGTRVLFLLILAEALADEGM
jgi:hypothetical protein